MQIRAPCVFCTAERRSSLSVLCASLYSRCAAVRCERGVSAVGRRVVVVAVLVAGCASFADLPEVDPMHGASRAPGRPWQPAATDAPVPLRGEQPPGLPSDLADHADRLTLAQLVDAALRENPSTR